MPVYVHFDGKSVEDAVNRILGKKIKSIYYQETVDEIAGEYAKHISKYVPYKTGALLGSARVENGEVVYSAKVARRKGNFDYAKIQYETPFPQSSRTTPETYDHWNRHLTTAERQEFYEDVVKIIVRGMNNAR